MFKKKILIIFIIVLSVFALYIQVNPLMKIQPLKLDYYTININKSPMFKLLPQFMNRYFIHPTSNKPTKVTFTFTKNLLLKLDFSIQKGSPSGDIEFIVKKNRKKLKNLIVTTIKSDTITLYAERGDKIEIIADKHGSNAGDWGNIELFEKDDLYTLKKFLIPFLWSLLFIFFFAKEHIFIAINSYLSFLLILFAEKLSFGTMGFETIMYYTILIFSLAFLFVLIYQELNIIKKFKIATIFSFIVIFFIYTIPLAIIIYTYNFNHSITSETLFAIFQTNKDESFEFITSSINIKYIIIFIIFTLFVASLLYIQELRETRKIEKSLLFFIIIILLTIFTMGYSYLRLPNFILDNYTQYNYELNKLMSMQKKRKSGEISFNATKKEKGETYILVIGESLNKYHMSTYGYLRNTTPRLSELANKNSILLFNNTYPNYTQTMQALSFALTEANQYNRKKYFDSLSIINIFNKASFDTYWITNQIMLSNFDNLISILGYDAKHLVQLNHHHGMESIFSYDGKSIEALKKILDKKTTKNRLIIIHLQGSHFAYSLRYPHDKFSKFKDKITQLEFGKYYKNKEVNDYDNSVYYNDYIIANLLKLLQKQQGANALLYFSDHSEDVLRGYKHHTPNLTPEMGQIPMIIWLSEDYKNKYKYKYKILATHKNNLFSNDMIYDTLIGLANITTDRYNTAYDFSSNKYNLKPKDALYLHGKRYYTEDNNYIYWRDRNSRYLNENNLTDKITIKSTNTIGKFNEIIYNGLNSFSLDIYYNSKKLYIGTKDKYIKHSLKEYLEKISLFNINSLYINLDNINRNNSDTILNELENINRLYKLKDKATLILNTKDINISKFKMRGWMISYKLDNNLKNINWEELKDWLQKNDISFVNIDKNTYSLVKEKLKDLNISYNIETNLSTKNKNFENSSVLKELYKENNIKSIFILFPSLYEL